MGGELPPDKASRFPNLQRCNYHVTSDETDEYNCIAHAAGRCDMPWWPIQATGVYWPDGIAMKETLECFVDAYETQGYFVCPDGSHELWYEKIAIYVDSKGTPAHAARQLEHGRWTSKLGDWEDIEHETLSALESSDYGTVAKYMKRPIKGRKKLRALRRLLVSCFRGLWSFRFSRK